MQVRTLLDSKGHHVVTVDRRASISSVVALLRDHGIGALVVIDRNGRLEGIISERDVVRHLATSGPDVVSDEVANLMSHEVLSCTPDTSCTELMELMTEHRIRHIPVVAHGELVGLVSIGDVVKARLGELERDRRELLDYVQAR